MKNKTQEWLRWVLAPLLAACLLGWLAAPAYPESAKQKTPGLKQTTNKQTNPKADTSTDAQEIRKLMDELQTREREDYTLVLEGQRKTIDWWFSFLGVVTAVMAVVGALIPFIMARKDRELAKEERESIKEDRAAISEYKKQIESAKIEISRLLDVAKVDAEEIHKQKDSITPLKPPEEEPPTSNGSAEKFKEGTSPPPKKSPQENTILTLRAAAITARQTGQADETYALWQALTVLDATDAIAHANAGYCALRLGRESQGRESVIRWLKQAGQHFHRAIDINPRDYLSFHNWGDALSMEAQAISAYNLKAARNLWQQASDMFHQALIIKPDQHVSASDWGAALMHEASALASTDPAKSRLLRDRAEKLLLEHAGAAPGVVAYNLACIYGLRGDVENCLKWLKTCQVHNTLESCDHLKTDHDLDIVRSAPEFIEWFNTVCP